MFEFENGFAEQTENKRKSNLRNILSCELVVRVILD